MKGQKTYTKSDVESNVCDWKPNKRFIDLKGKSFGELTVICIHKRVTPHTYWFVECTCGKIISQSTNALHRGRDKCKDCSFTNMGLNRLKPVNVNVKSVLDIHTTLKFINPSHGKDTKSEWLWYCPLCNTPFYHSVDRLKSTKNPLCRCNPHKFSRWTQQLRTCQIKEIAFDRGLSFLGWKDTYKSNSSRFYLKCEKHKHYESSVANFTNKSACYGCPYCADEKKGSHFRHDKQRIETEGGRVHGIDTYDFSEFDYKDSRTSGKVVCNSCQESFYNSYDNIVNKGQGCRCKAKYGYQTNKIGTLYIQSIGDKALKYGITNHDPFERMRVQSKESLYEHKMLYYFTLEDGGLVLDCENNIKRKVGGKFLSKEELPDGYTETLDIKQLEGLLGYIKSRLGEPSFVNGDNK